MMPDEDLYAAIDRMASSSQARGGVIGYYIAEADRRDRRKLERTMVRLTWVIAVLTAFLALHVVLTVASQFPGEIGRA